MDDPHKPSQPIGRPRFEPWPWMLGGLLAAMIVISVAFLVAALSHPDVDVREGRGTPRAAAATTPPAVAPEVQAKR